MRVLRCAPRWLLLQSLLLALGVASLLWNLVAAALYPLMPKERALVVGRVAISRLYSNFWSLARACGMLELHNRVLDPLRDEPGLIIVANHPSMMDALMLVARLPRSACIMKAELMRNVFLGSGARLARYIRNDSPRGMIKLAVEDLRRGGQLVLFPEGTRTTTATVNEFRPGVTLIAKLAQAPIQTVFIDTDSPYLGKGWPLWRLPPTPIVFHLRLGRRFAPQPDTTQLLQDLQAYFAAGVRPRTHTPGA